MYHEAEAITLNIVQRHRITAKQAMKYKYPLNGPAFRTFLFLLRPPRQVSFV